MKHEYTDEMVTAWGGMKEMKLLIDKTGISKKLLELGLPESKSNNSIDSISIVESFWVSIWIGCHRFSHTAVVRVDEVLRQIFGWKRVASGSTYGRFFKKFTPSMNHHLFIDLCRWFFEQLKADLSLRLSKIHHCLLNRLPDSLYTPLSPHLLHSPMSPQNSPYPINDDPKIISITVWSPATTYTNSYP